MLWPYGHSIARNRRHHHHHHHDHHHHHHQHASLKTFSVATYSTQSFGCWTLKDLTLTKINAAAGRSSCLGKKSRAIANTTGSTLSPMPCADFLGTKAGPLCQAKYQRLCYFCSGRLTHSASGGACWINVTLSMLRG